MIMIRNLVLPFIHQSKRKVKMRKMTENMILMIQMMMTMTLFWKRMKMRWMEVEMKVAQKDLNMINMGKNMPSQSSFVKNVNRTLLIIRGIIL